MKLLLYPDELIQVLRRELNGRRVLIVTERDFRIAFDSEGNRVPTVVNDEILREIGIADYTAQFHYLLPNFTILLLDVRKGKRKRKYAFLFLPKQFYLAELIGIASLFGVASTKQRKVVVFPVRMENEVKLLSLIRSLNSFDIHHRRALEILNEAFPGADWIIEYYTRDAQIERDNIGVK